MNNEYVVKENCQKTPKVVHITILVNIFKHTVNENVMAWLVHS